MFDLIASGNAPLTMTSCEIAELTGKAHKNVLADIRVMLAELGLTSADFSADLPDAYGRMQPAFTLPHRECMILVSGYSVTMRAKIVDRWVELESGRSTPSSPVLSHSYADAVAGAEVVARMLRLEGAAALGMVRKATEITAPHLLPMLPVYAIDAPSGSGAVSSEATDSLSALMKANDIKGSAASMNVRLALAGYLERKTREGKSGSKEFWSVTEAGQKYGKNLTSPQNPRETQPHWYRDKFLDLMSAINAK